jgi:hypothetical protein
VGVLRPGARIGELGAVKLGTLGQLVVWSSPAGCVIAGAVTSITVIVWLVELVLPESSPAVHVRVITLVQPIKLVVVTASV